MKHIETCWFGSESTMTAGIPGNSTTVHNVSVEECRKLKITIQGGREHNL